MPEGLAPEDGTAIALDAPPPEFARAMAAPEPGEPEHPAPPRREQLSEEELGAKYGWTTNPDGTRRAKRAGAAPPVTLGSSAAPAAAEKPARGKGEAEPKPDL